MRKIIIISLVSIFLTGCAGVPIKDGELAIGKDTTAGVEDVGVAKLTRQF